MHRPSTGRQTVEGSPMTTPLARDPQLARDIRTQSVRVARWHLATYPSIESAVEALRFQSGSSHQGYSGWRTYRRAADLLTRWSRRFA